MLAGRAPLLVVDRLWHRQSRCLLIFIVQMGWLFVNGVGIWGMNIPVAWGFAIAEYVWWIALASGGTIVSALFYLTRSPWRAATNRIAETMLLSAAPCAGLFADHASRPPGFILLAVSLFERDGRVAAGAQPAVVGFHLPALLHPDVDHVLLRRLAAGSRDHARYAQRTARQQIFYGVLALGWRGSARQWRNQQIVYAIMSAIMAPMVISVHSVVGLDFAGGLTPGWHSPSSRPTSFSAR